MTKYVSVRWTFMARAATHRPVRPPIVNRPMNPMAHSIGVVSMTWPLYSVAVQLNTLMADGTPMMNDRTEKTVPAYTLWPDTNRWWPQTRNPTRAMARLANAMAVDPNTR